MCSRQRIEDARKVAGRKGKSKRKEHKEIGCNSAECGANLFLAEAPNVKSMFRRGFTGEGRNILK